MRQTLLFLCSGNYYRSRFAELVFNDRAVRLGLSWRAISAGLLPEYFAGNPGPISQHVVNAAEERGLTLAEPYALPRALDDQLLADSQRIIALDRDEHFHIVRERFPDYLDRITFWDVADVGFTPPPEALAAIEHRVGELVEELAS